MLHMKYIEKAKACLSMMPDLRKIPQSTFKIVSPTDYLISLQQPICASALTIADTKDGKRMDSDHSGHFFIHNLSTSDHMTKDATARTEDLLYTKFDRIFASSSHDTLQQKFYDCLVKCRSSIAKAMLLSEKKVRNEQELHYAIGNHIAEAITTLWDVNVCNSNRQIML